jgi:hypothetical protein
MIGTGALDRLIRLTVHHMWRLALVGEKSYLSSSFAITMRWIWFAPS